MIKVRLIPSRTKRGKGMEKIVPQNVLLIYAELLVNGLIKGEQP